MYEIYKISIKPLHADAVMALISNECEIEGISYEDDGFSFYVKQNNDTDVGQILNRIRKQFEFDYSHKSLEQRNWNEVWESSFEPVEVDKFCRIRAQFHPHSPEFKHDIVIHPGMAFGTGHHETTTMMVATMSQLDLKGKKFLDAGCGTGVLAILAQLEGADNVEAFDIDINSVESIRQNIKLNNSHNISISHCELHDFKGGNYDVIAANINLNVLINGLPNLKNWLADMGTIIVSGYLVVDIDKIVKIASHLGLTLLSTKQKGEWVCQTFR